MSEIYDIGYRHYDGPRLGRGYSTRALTVHSLRGVFGLGRTARSKIMPFALGVIMLLPAVVSIAMMALIKQHGMSYSSFAVSMQTVLAIFLASQSPTVVAPDLRYRVLPLYLSRPVAIAEYVTAKVIAMTVALFLLIALPMTLIYVGELLIDLEGPPQTKEYLGALAMALVLALLLSSFGLAIASLTPRRGLGVASIIAVYLLASASVPVIYGTLQSAGNTSGALWAWLVNPFWLVDAVQVWLFDTTPNALDGSGYPPGPAPAIIVVVLIAIGLAALAARYRKAAAQ
ncbi:ABC transporter permease [Nonomuraea sp. NEAU-A123]|uniref:ABC transporter permease n=1 Tax=Nonomuraea sp. NEAU-A123 TaxID=2839649 RepID=UPI001BE43053|nr:ABC transporter permease [Nonomuraea sp. NEAU-A123]MBT2224284.1 ABC transporter permease [Nonomuraea sp. NEAU-A123]